MMNLSQLLKLSPGHWGTLVVAYLGCICSGVLILFRYRPEIVHDYDVLKLILLGSAIIMPLLVWNIVILLPLAVANHLTPDEKDDEKILAPAFTQSSLALFVVVYSAVFLSYWLCLSFRGFLYTAAIEQVIFTIAVLMKSCTEFRHNKES